MSHESVGKSDEWYTPRYIFDALGVRFDLDVAAPKGGPRHVPAMGWYSERSLERDWLGFVWMNPPYGNQKMKRAWLNKFFDHGNGIALMPDRTSAPWWQEAAAQSHGVLFMAPKVKFEREDGTTGESPANGTTLFASRERALSVLKDARKLGILMNQA